MKTFKALLTFSLFAFPLATAAHDLSAVDHGMQPETMQHGAIVGVMTNTINASDNIVLIKDSNITLSKNDRVQLAQTIKEMMESSQELGPVSAMTTEDLFILLTNSTTNPSMLSHVAGIIGAARSGNTGALAGHVVGLLRFSIPIPSSPKSTSTAAD
ncbi:uncharacterized protein PHALS_01708 [Plasmopara halstedii]|uniref:RxLR-like protein n=1 Tax=Plasmopara halstedii TaxID=4781 RepID=A0A0P1AVH9_PLAHL|nr:uncharacterized protein PHALS_01708 [Plasmopara halstedii]CEG45410.1 hypothetical protein PHALS_01708 [Plasmopara halstedii]|eukprot:XP_024581779.1 hypothetical protein PHALS_01708 [Plasmopara halstedii]